VSGQIDDETLPNFIKKKHPRKREERKQGARIEVQASKEPNKGPQGGKGTTKN
jgi:hypothetical protein